MRHVLSLSVIGAAALGSAIATQAVAQSNSTSLAIDQVTAALKGKLCTTKGGAKFTFTSDGHYGYAGLGRTHSGHYWIADGTVTVLLDNGLGRSFSVSTKDDILYMEQTALQCAVLEDRKVTASAVQ